MPPACILLSDGYCTDPEEEYNKAIEKLDLHPWGVKASRISIGVGGNYNKKQLDQFIAPHLRLPPDNLETLPATTPKQLVKYIRTSSTLAAKGKANTLGGEQAKASTEDVVKSIYDTFDPHNPPSVDEEH